jgi:hypothetical protein
MNALAQNVRGIQVPNSGHWIAEEQPDSIIKLLDSLFSGNYYLRAAREQEIDAINGGSAAMEPKICIFPRVCFLLVEM